MYYKGKDKEEMTIKVPFDVICTNCGSHNVDVTAFEYWNLGITCKNCGSYLEHGSYNPTRYCE